MRIGKIDFRKIIFLNFIALSLFSLNTLATDFQQKIAIQQLLEEQNPSVSFSFSKNIIDFFDTDLDWKNGKEHLEGDFSKAAFYVFDENTSNEKLHELFKKQHYILIKIDSEEGEEGEISMYVDQKGKEVEEAHFVIKNDEKLIVFSLYGKMRLKEKK